MISSGGLQVAAVIEEGEPKEKTSVVTVPLE